VHTLPELRKLDTTGLFRPPADKNGLISKNVVLLPSRATEYGSQADLVAKIIGFIRRYADVLPFWDRNPADAVEVRRPDDQRERYLEVEEIASRKTGLDQKMYRKSGKGVNETFFRLRLIVLIALTTGMRIAEIFGLTWNDLMYREELIAVRAKLKGGKMRYVPMPPELAAEFKKYPVILGRIGSFLPSLAPSANARGWTRALRPS